MEQFTLVRSRLPMLAMAAVLTIAACSTGGAKRTVEAGAPGTTIPAGLDASSYTVPGPQNYGEVAAMASALVVGTVVDVRPIVTHPRDSDLALALYGFQVTRVVDVHKNAGLPIRTQETTVIGFAFSTTQDPTAGGKLSEAIARPVPGQELALWLVDESVVFWADNQAHWVLAGSNYAALDVVRNGGVVEYRSRATTGPMRGTTLDDKALVGAARDLGSVWLKPVPKTPDVPYGIIEAPPGGTVPGQGARDVKVRPKKDLRDGDTVTVDARFGGGTAALVGVAMCVVGQGKSGLDSCDATTATVARTAPDGTLTLSYTVRRLLRIGASNIDCADQGQPCILGVSPLADFSKRKMAVLHFDANVPVAQVQSPSARVAVASTIRITVTPPSGLRDGDRPAVRVEGLVPGAGVGLSQCSNEVASLALGACDISTVMVGTADGTGALETTLPVRTTIQIATGPRDCRLSACVIAAAPLGTLAAYATTPISLL